MLQVSFQHGSYVRSGPRVLITASLRSAASLFTPASTNHTNTVCSNDSRRSLLKLSSRVERSLDFSGTVKKIRGFLDINLDLQGRSDVVLAGPAVRGRGAESAE